MFCKLSWEISDFRGIEGRLYIFLLDEWGTGKAIMRILENLRQIKQKSNLPGGAEVREA